MTDQPTTVVSTRRRQIALWALCLTQIVGFGTLYYALPVALDDIQKSTGFGAELITGIYSGSLVLTAVLGIPLGRAIDRYGSRIVMTLGSLIGTVALALVGISNDLPLFIFGWLLIGVASAMSLYAPTFAAITRWFQPHPVKALTLVTLLGGLASTIFAPLVSILIEQFGWQTMYLILSAIFGSITIPLHGSALLSNRYFPHPDVTDSSKIYETNTDLPPIPSHSLSIQKIITSGPFILLTLALTMPALGLYAMNLTLIQFFAEKGLSLFLGSIALGIFGAGQLIGRFFYPVMSDRLPPSKQISSSLIIAVALMVCTIALEGPIWLLMTLIALIGAVRGLMTLVQANVVRELWPPQLYGTLSGIMGAPITIAMAISPWLGTLIAQAADSYHLANIVFAAFTVIGLMLALLIKTKP